MHRIFIALLLIGCLEAPAEGDILITVMAPQENPTADGAGRAEIEIVLGEASRQFGRDVSVRVDGAQLGAEGPFKAPEDGVLLLPIRYDRRPGPVQIDVRSGPNLGTSTALVLAPRAPDRFAVHPPERVLDGAGDSAAVQMTLVVDAPQARPSVGTRVWFAACCEGPRACADPPLRVPSVATMDETTDAVTVNVTVRPQPIVAEPTRIEGLFAFAIDGPPDCETAALLARVPIDLPVDPFAGP